jgi:hypothetical protein
MGIVMISETSEPVGISIFHIQENLNMGNVDGLVQAAISAHKAGKRKIILDFSKIQYISSAGIRGLMEIYHLFNDAETDDGSDLLATQTVGGKMKCNLWLSNCSGLILKTLNIAAVTDIIPLSETWEEAVEKISA